jgi:hypothetical protein
MVALLQSNHLAEDPENLVGFLGLLILAGGGGWMLIRWLLNAPTQSDPWDAGIAAGMAAEFSI